MILTQKRKTKGKVYSLHAPEVECIAKGKAHRPYEFGVKVSLAVTHKEGFVVGIQSCPENPYDGHTLGGQLDQVERLTRAALQGLLRRLEALLNPQSALLAARNAWRGFSGATN